jgi:hypothetical protein
VSFEGRNEASLHEMTSARLMPVAIESEGSYDPEDVEAI